MTPDLSKYAFVFRGNNPIPWEVDIVHMMQLWKVVEETTPARIVEVGSFQGASAALWIEALHQGLCEEVHLFEIKPTANLLKVIDLCQKPNRIVLHQQPYYEFPLQAEFIFIDADHGWGALADLSAALAARCEIIAMHDTMGFVKADLKDCWGSWMAANIMRQATGYVHFEDHKKRHSVFTERGIMVSRRSL